MLTVAEVGGSEGKPEDANGEDGKKDEVEDYDAMKVASWLNSGDTLGLDSSHTALGQNSFWREDA